MWRNASRFALAVATMLAAGGQAVAQSGAPSAAQSGTAPADVVRTIYDRVAVFCRGEDVAPPYVDKFMRETFEKPVADRYLARLHKSQIDFDIFIDGQDCKLANLLIEPLEAMPEAAVVRVRLDNFDTARTIDFAFRNSGSAWMIADMIYRHRAFTLRSYLKLKPRG